VSSYEAAVAHADNAPLPMQLLNARLLTVQRSAMIVRSASAARLILFRAQRERMEQYASLKRLPPYVLGTRHSSHVIDPICEKLD
jgi:hypothetical protein